MELKWVALVTIAFFVCMALAEIFAPSDTYSRFETCYQTVKEAIPDESKIDERTRLLELCVNPEKF